MNNKKGLTSDRSDQLLLIMTFMFLGASYFYGTDFANPDNFKAVLIDFVKIGFVSIGMMALLISGVFDLSVGSIFAIGMAVVAICLGGMDFTLFKYTSETGEVVPFLLTIPSMPWPLAVLLTLLVCGLCGAINGTLVTKMKINPLIATLGTMGIFRGIVIGVSDTGKEVPAECTTFSRFGGETILGLPAPIWFLFLAVGLFVFMFRYLKLFRKFYFVGGNKDAAKLCGIDGDKIWFIGFVIIALLAGFAGILFCSRLGASSVQAGEGMELSAIAGVVIGGASIKGGKGTILGGFLGALFMALVFNIIGMAGISGYWQPIVNGAILIVAVYTDVIAEQGAPKFVVWIFERVMRILGKSTSLSSEKA